MKRGVVCRDMQTLTDLLDAGRPPGSPRCRVVVASGYFNPVHIGHINYLRYAKDCGDILVVIVNNDIQVGLKNSVPFMVEQERLEVIASLWGVYAAILAIDTDRSVSRTLEAVCPDVFVNGGDVTMCHGSEAAVCCNFGIKMQFGVGGINKQQSSSSLIKSVKHRCM